MNIPDISKVFAGVKTRRQLVKAKQAARDKEVYGRRNEIRARRPQLLQEAAIKKANHVEPAKREIPPLMRTRRNARGHRHLVPVKAKRYVQEHLTKHGIAS